MKAGMRNGLLSCILLFLSLLATGQNAPAFRQFYFNPYLFNPAFAGMNGYTEVSLVYRQQWLGFNNAPSVTGITLQYPSQNRASFGMNFLTQEVVALRTTSTQATFAYRIPITANQFLFFGLSGVAGYNDLNLNGADYSNDPTILHAASSTFYGDANFGLVYSLGSLRLGFALPKLFGQHYFSPQDLVNTRYAQLRNQLYSASYKFTAGSFSFEPYALYRMNRDLQNWWEAATLVYFKEKIWTGVSYNSARGLGFFLGADIKEKLRFGYSYEVPLANSEFIFTSSHEVHLQLRLGKKRVFKWAARFAEPEKKIAEAVEPTNEELALILKIVPSEVTEKPKEEPLVSNVVEKKVVTEPANKIIGKAETNTVHTRPPEQSTLAAGIYIIAGSFQSLDFAKAHKKLLSTLGYQDVKSGMNPNNKLFYVYVFSSYDLEESRKMRDQLHLKEATKAAWILKIE